MGSQAGQGQDMRVGYSLARSVRFLRVFGVAFFVMFCTGCYTIAFIVVMPIFLVVAPLTLPFFMLVSAETGVTSAEFSPDGSHVLLAYKLRDGSNLYKVSLDGKSWDPLTENEFAFDPIYSPDGSQIAYCSRVGARRRYLHVMEEDGANAQQISSGRRVDYTPRYSPDGSRIVFTSMIGDQPSDLYVLDVASEEVRQLTSDEETYDINPVFLPGGATVLFARVVDRKPDTAPRFLGSHSMYTVRVDGTELTEVPFRFGGASESKDGSAFESEDASAGDKYLLHKDRLLALDCSIAERLAGLGARLLTGGDLPFAFDALLLYAKSPQSPDAVVYREIEGTENSNRQFEYHVVCRYKAESGETRKTSYQSPFVKNLRYAPSGSHALFISQGRGSPTTTSSSKWHDSLWIVPAHGAARRIDKLFPGTPKWVR